MSQKGIDVSVYQGKPDWKKVEADGVNFAFIRAGYGKNNVDEQLVYNGEKAVAAGLAVHFYWFSYAYTKEMVIDEANFLMQQAKKYAPNCMLAWDFEYDSMKYAEKKGVTITKSTLTKWCIAFCETVKAGGFTPVIYANEDYFKNNIDISEILSKTNAKIWLAKYASTSGTYGKNAYIWQYSSTGKVKGIEGNVDMNIGYFEAKTKVAKKSNTPTVKKATVTSTKTTTTSKKYTQKNFIKDVQTACGAKVDGIAGPETLSKTITISAKVNNRHAVVIIIQKYLTSIGHDCGTADGIAGPKFTLAVNSYQKAVLGIKKVDGEITAKGGMWRSLLGLK